jgi:spore coat polysaccharide biosynthesis predicted glycosyltransferase SpsG
MKIALRFDADQRIGAGHAMRSLVLAKDLLALGVEVSLYASIELPWINSIIQTMNANYESVKCGSLDFLDHEKDLFDLVVIDGYQYNSQQIATLCGVENVALFMDYDYEFLGQIMTIHQGLEIPPTWIIENSDQILTGKEFLLISQEIRSIKYPGDAFLDPINGLLVLGSTVRLAEINSILELLNSLSYSGRLSVVSPENLSHELIRTSFPLSLAKPSAFLLGNSSSFSFVISAPGSMLWELSYIGIPSVYVRIADNQLENIRQIDKYSLGLDLGVVDSKSFQTMAQKGSPLDAFLTKPESRLFFAKQYSWQMQF